MRNSKPASERTSIPDLLIRSWIVRPLVTTPMASPVGVWTAWTTESPARAPVTVEMRSDSTGVSENRAAFAAALRTGSLAMSKPSTRSVVSVLG